MIRVAIESSDLPHGLYGRVVVHHMFLLLTRILSLAAASVVAGAGAVDPAHLSIWIKRVRGPTVFAREYCKIRSYAMQ